MLVTLDLPADLEQRLQTQADYQQISVSELIENLLVQTVTTTSPPVMTLEVIEQAYADEWVVVEITDFDTDENPTKGIVVDHNINREPLADTIRQIWRTQPDKQLYTFYTGDPIPHDTFVSPLNLTNQYLFYVE